MIMKKDLRSMVVADTIANNFHFTLFFIIRYINRRKTTFLFRLW